jgi:hypothetical protein
LPLRSLKRRAGHRLKRHQALAHWKPEWGLAGPIARGRLSFSAATECRHRFNIPDAASHDPRYNRIARVNGAHALRDLTRTALTLYNLSKQANRGHLAGIGSFAVN